MTNQISLTHSQEWKKQKFSLEFFESIIETKYPNFTRLSNDERLNIFRIEFNNFKENTNNLEFHIIHNKTSIDNTLQNP